MKAKDADGFRREVEQIQEGVARLMTENAVRTFVDILTTGEDVPHFVVQHIITQFFEEFVDIAKAASTLLHMLDGVETLGGIREWVQKHGPDPTSVAAETLDDFARTYAVACAIEGTKPIIEMDPEKLRGKLDIDIALDDDSPEGWD